MNSFIFTCNSKRPYYLVTRDTVNYPGEFSEADAHFWFWCFVGYGHVDAHALFPEDTTAKWTTSETFLGLNLEANSLLVLKR